jgi:hypothetical protein
MASRQEHTTMTTTPADRPVRAELDAMDRAAELVERFAADYREALAGVPGGRVRARVRAWSDDYAGAALRGLLEVGQADGDGAGR